MSYEEEMRNLLSGVPDEFEPLQQTLDVWMDLPEPEPARDRSRLAALAGRLRGRK